MQSSPPFSNYGFSPGARLEFCCVGLGPSLFCTNKCEVQLYLAAEWRCASSFAKYDGMNSYCFGIDFTPTAGWFSSEWPFIRLSFREVNQSYNHSRPFTGAFLFDFDFGFAKLVSILRPFRENGPGLSAGWIPRFDSGWCGTRVVFEVELLLWLAATWSISGRALFSALVLVGGGRNVGRAGTGLFLRVSCCCHTFSSCSKVK